MKHNIYILLCLVLCIVSCKYFENEQILENEITIAKVANTHLYLSDLEKLGLDEVNKKDSIQMANTFVNNWIKSQLFLQKAETYLKTEQITFDKQVKEYKNSLLSYNYEKELIKENVNNEVTFESIQNYYDTYYKNFKLNETIIKPRYIKLSTEGADIEEIESWIRSDEPEKVELFKDFALQHTQNYCLGNNWFNKNDFLKDLPFSRLPDEKLLDRKTFFRVTENGETHMLFMLDYGKKDSVAPIDYKKQDIEKIIVNKRKTDYIKKVKEDIYADAINNKEFEIFEIE